MYAEETATADQRRECPYRFDRIEVQVETFTTPAAVDYRIQADLNRPTEPLAFCILGAFHCHKADDPDMGMLTVQAASVAGVGGWFGFAGARRLRFGKGEGMNNSDMIPGRYHRWAEARRKLAWVKERLAGGRTVYLSTALRRVKLTPKHIEMVRATRDGLFVSPARPGCATPTAACRPSRSTMRLDRRRSARRPCDPISSNSCEAFMPTFTFSLAFKADVADLSAARDLGAAALAHMQETFNDDGSLDGWRVTARQVSPGTESVPAPEATGPSAV